MGEQVAGVPEHTAVAEPKQALEIVRGQAEADAGADLAGPAFDRLGAEGLRRLRGRYHDVAARLAERPEDERTAELSGEAERLNPDGWLSDEAVVRGLEEYESVLERLRAVVGIRRRRRRRSPQGTVDADAPAGAVSDTSNNEASPTGAATFDEAWDREGAEPVSGPGDPHEQE